MTQVATVTIQAAQVSADLTDFPLLVDLSDMPAGFWSTVANGGGDIRVFKADGVTELPREVVSCDTVTDTGELWVNFSGILSSSSNTEIQIHADGASVDYAVGATYGRNAVWSGYVSAWHLNQDGTGGAGSIIDSAGLHDGTPSGWASSGSIAGPWGATNALDFAPNNNNYISIGDFSDYELMVSGGPNFAVSFWSYPESESQFAIAKDNEWSAYSQGDGATSPRLNTYGGNNTSGLGNTVPLNAWSLITHFVNVGTKIRSYLDGPLVNDVAVSDVSAGTANSLEIGRTTIYLDGRLAEMRIAIGAQADRINATGWTTTEYSNQSSPSTFYTVAAVTVGLTLTAITPTTGPSSGGTTVTMTGTGFAEGTVPKFNGVAATDVFIVSDTELTCVTPAL